MQFLPLPAYRPAGPLDFSGLAGAFDNARRNRLAEAGLQLQQDQFGLQRRQADEAFARQKARDAAWDAIKSDKAALAALPNGAAPFVLAAGAERGPDLAASALLNRQNTDLQRQQLNLQNQQLQAQIAQNAAMNPLFRAKTEAEVRALTQRDPEREFMSRLYGGMLQQMPGQQAPASPVQRQSFGGGGFEGATPQLAFQPGGMDEPALIRTQAAPSGGAAPQPQQEMVTVPGIGTVPKAVAEQMQFALSKDRGAVVGEAVKKFDLGKEAANENDKRELAAIEGLYRLRTIAQGFKPEWQTYEQGMRQKLVGWADSFESIRGKLKPEELQRHVEFVQFKRDATSYLTEGIKAATGAAMGIQEEARIRAGLPDPQKDGPTAFAAKLQGTQRDLELTVMRTRYLRQNGFRGVPWRGDGSAAERALPIDQFRRIMNERKEQLYQELRRQQPQAPREELIPIVGQLLNREFGI